MIATATPSSALVPGHGRAIAAKRRKAAKDRELLVNGPLVCVACNGASLANSFISCQHIVGSCAPCTYKNLLQFHRRIGACWSSATPHLTSGSRQRCDRNGERSRLP